jgi:light-regulated signal transduction histidine kinase (bacteriophytochrome)
MNHSARVDTTDSKPAESVGFPQRPRQLPTLTALAYFASGAAWISFTDNLVVPLQLDRQLSLALQNAQGWLFVIGSAVLLYLLLKRAQRRNDAVLNALLESQDEVRRINADLERRVISRTRQLEAANKELEAFAYAVSHDLRAPLRSLSGFSQILRETGPAELDEQSRHYLQRIHDSSLRMSALIEDLLSLSRINRAELSPRTVSLSQLVTEAVATVRERNAGRDVQITVEPDMIAQGDGRLLRIAVENLIDNAWKYTAPIAKACISVGVQPTETGPVYYVRDNGVGFNMAYADKLFGPFQRLHSESQFEGTGIGLVTVQRILARHGGRIWAEATPNAGACFYFTIGTA